MPPSPDLLSWEFWVEALGFWARDTESLYRLALIVAGLIGIPLLYSRTRSANRSARAALEQAKVAADQAKTAAERHDEQTKADRERRITESFAKAVEQLGSEKLETRLGGIYTLERIARESEREYWPIMETLTAFVRERAPWPPRQALGNPLVELQVGGGEANGEETEEVAELLRAHVRPATDIQAVLTVLGRRDETARKQDEEAHRSLNLSATDLRGAYLRGAHLEGAALGRTHLEGAALRGAHLEGADLSGAHLEGADLSGAHLERASFFQAHLERANLNEAHLAPADLGGAHLEGAALRGAHLERANLIQAHLEGADLRNAHLERASFFQAHLEGAALGGHLEGVWLVEAHLEGAALWGHLEGANLDGAHLEGAALGGHLEGANLDGAHLQSAHLWEAIGLTQEQLDKANGDDRTVLPDGLTRPAHWPAEAADAPDNAT